MNKTSWSHSSTNWCGRIQNKSNLDLWVQVGHLLEFPRNIWGKDFNISKGSDWECVWGHKSVYICMYVHMCAEIYKCAVTNLSLKFLSLVQTPPDFFLPATMAQDTYKNKFRGRLLVSNPGSTIGHCTLDNCFNFSVLQNSGINVRMIPFIQTCSYNLRHSSNICKEKWSLLYYRYLNHFLC